MEPVTARPRQPTGQGAHRAGGTITHHSGNAERMIAVLLSLTYLAATGAFGVLLLHRLARCALDRLELVSYGAPFGVILGSAALLAASLAGGLSAWTVMIVAAAAALCAVTMAWPQLGATKTAPDLRTRMRGIRLPGFGLVADIRCRIGLFPIAVLTSLILLWGAFYLTMTSFRDGALWASQIHIWSDLPVHLGQITSFAYAGNFPPSNPFYANEPLSYHYLISLTAAGMVQLGLEPLVALRLHDFLLMAMVTVAIFAFARRLSGNRNAAALATLLFLLGSGLGWLVTAGAINQSHDILEVLRENAWNYQDVSRAGIHWEPVFLVAIAPTRGTLYGLALGILTLALLYQAVRSRERRLFLLAGAIAGLLPLAHMGTLLALAMITPFLFLLFPSRRWFFFFAVWVVVALPQIYLQGGLSGGTGRVHWHTGWMADQENVIWFWLTNLGLFVPLLALALVDRTSSPARTRRFLWAFMPIFVVANLVALDPTGPWNNLKVLIYWFLAVCVLVAALLARTWEEQRTPLVRGLILGTLAVMLLSGVLMHLHVALGKNSYMVFSRTEVELARAVREGTPPDAVFVSGTQHDPVITALAGRQTLIFFTPYLVSWGIDPAARERDVRAIYAFAPDALDLLRRYNVSYVVIGPAERNGLHANSAAYRARFPIAFAAEGYEIFDVSGPPADAGPESPSALAQGEPPYHPRSEGECIQAESGGPSYYLQTGLRRLIPDDQTRIALGCGEVWSWGDQSVQRIPEGDPIPAAR
jgi:hypothetical protein